MKVISTMTEENSQSLIFNALIK